MHWVSVCYILLVSSVFQEVFSTESPQGSGASSFSDDEDLYEEPSEEKLREKLEKCCNVKTYI